MKLILRFIVFCSLAATTTVRADTTLVFNEIMYHPETNEAAFEWVELYNQMAVDLDVSGWRITEGVNYTFPEGTVIKGRSYIVVATNLPALQTNGVSNVFGPFIGRLGNDGETLLLRDRNNRVVDSISYGVRGDWPVPPDGAGPSLAKIDPDTGSSRDENWASSEQRGGTPGAANFPLLTGSAAPVRLISAENQWKYDDSNVDRGTAWRETNYDDSTWNSASALFYRGSFIAGETVSIPGVFSTGIGTNGQALTAGQADPHYILTFAAQGASNIAATAMDSHPAWLGADASSTFIGVVPSGNTSINGGAYWYRTTFNLDGFDLNTVQLRMNVAIDNQLTNVFLNGVAKGVAHVGFAELSPTFLITNGFIGGTNTLEFRTLNDGAGPGGFRALLSATGFKAQTNTTLAAGANTHYFRKTFVHNGDPETTALQINSILDDGAIFYLNGVEVLRRNMPGGAIFNTPALTDVGSPAYSGPLTIPTGALVNGTNVLAVELHQANGSTDALFGAELLATVIPRDPVTVALNEIHTEETGDFWLELYNYGTNTFDLAAFKVLHDGPSNLNSTATLSGSLAPSAYKAFHYADLGFAPAPGDKLVLFRGNSAIDGVVAEERNIGRFPNGTGDWLYPQSGTLEAANAVNLNTNVVINEIMYNHQLVRTNGFPEESAEEWIELHNRGLSAANLTGWRLDGGIEFAFPTNKMIAPGGYLVVAKRAASLRTVFPSADIIGDFSGTLRNSDEVVLLKDPNDNPADRVHYYDRGRWPEYADGGGSSLELRDPSADNSLAETWAASQEGGKSTWQTYSYRGVAAAVVSQPAVWNDFILGLLGAGECLIDDISVIETPATTPIQFISNGNFENGMTGWRVVGTHNRTRVIVDPGNGGNHVLHVVATGPQEHMHNHVEATYTAGRVVTNGKEYEISFKAKWLAGNNLLNTRLYFNRVARTTVLPTPQNNGTPGEQNSVYAGNIGPTFTGLKHAKVIPQPNEAVTVTASLADPHGIGTVEVLWSANGGSWNTAPMSTNSDGSYVGTIPGRPAGTIVQFYVRAQDGLGAVSTFPAAGPDSGALYMVSDGLANVNLAHNMRIILSPTNRALLHAFTNVMSNDRLPGTLIYDERIAYYDLGVRLKGSERGRYSDTRVSFSLEFQPDDLFRGVHPVMLLDRSGAGDSGVNKQQEILIKHMLQKAGGILGAYTDVCRIIAPFSTGSHTGPGLLFPRAEDELIETSFDNGGDGAMFELELIYYPTTANAAGYKNPNPDSVITGVDIADHGNDKEPYRYNFITKNHRAVDDYSRFINFAKPLSLTGSALDAQSKQMMDVDRWLRAWALVTLCGVGDTYTFGNNHNLLMYQRPSDGRMLPIPWDMDFSFNRGTGDPLVGDQNVSKVINLPGNLRCFYAHILDILDKTYNPAYMAYWVSHYNTFCPGQNFAPVTAYIQARNTFARNAINTAGGTTPFAVTSTNNIVTTSNLVTISGTAPVQVKTITINGQEYPVTWTSLTAWTIRVPVGETNQLVIVPQDLAGNTLSNFIRTVSLEYNGPPVDPLGNVLISEIMYNPVQRNSGFLEIFNRSTDQAFDLSGWRINGVDYTFPSGSIITQRQNLVIASHRGGFVSTYGLANSGLFDVFDGNLQNDGETLTLLKPGAASGEETAVDKVRYESVLPWSTGANGSGLSLQLIDAAQDNSRVSNWKGEVAWTQRVRTGNIVNATNLLLWITGTGNAYIDDITLIGPEGTNVLENGGFETGNAAPWIVPPAYTNSSVTSQIAHSGQYSLFLNGSTPSVQVSNTVQQLLAGKITLNGVYTLSFWTLPYTNSVVVNMRGLPGNNLTTSTNTQIITSTPGLVNSATDVLPPYDTVWLNELQAENVGGLQDGQAEREPWVELYNGGSNVVSLAGYYLANNYTSNLLQWAFPSDASIAPGQFKIVWLDGETNESSGAELHTSFRLNASTGSVALVRIVAGSPQITDYLTYAGVGPALSYGDYPDGQPFHRQIFFNSTPGGTNTFRTGSVFINEWMADNTSYLADPADGAYQDWFEIYNPNPFVVDLSNYYLSDVKANSNQFRIPDGYTVPANGYLLVWADNDASQNGPDKSQLHASFALRAAGEDIAIFDVDGLLVDSITFTNQNPDISEGRYPNGSSLIDVMQTPTPGAANVGSGGNSPPSITPVGNRFMYLGQALTFGIQATDPENHALTYSLPIGPAGAFVNPTTGAFSWTPTSGQAPSTNNLTVRVADNGVPSMDATANFTVTVLLPPNINISRNGTTNLFMFPAIQGKHYILDYTDTLNPPIQWQPIGQGQAQGDAITLVDDSATGDQRFYKVRIVD